MRLLIALLSSGAAAALSATTARPSAVGPTNLYKCSRTSCRATASVTPPDGAKRIEEAVGRSSKRRRPTTRSRRFRGTSWSSTGTGTLRFTNNAPPPPPDWCRSTVGPGGPRRRAENRRDGRRVKNCVTVAPWPSAVLDGLDGLPLIGAPRRALGVGRAEPGPQPRWTATARRPGRGKAAGTNRVNIVFERLDRTLDRPRPRQGPGVRGAAPGETGYDVPEIARAANAAFAATGLDGSAFDTTYCDETLRISRGGNPLRGELRVFTRVAPPAPPSQEVADEDRFIVAPDMEGDPEDSMPSD